MARRVLLLTQWFDPEPTFKGMAFARELVRRGFDVDVLTGFPNYPGGKVYPGYRIKWVQHEEIDGVRVTRVPLFPSHGRSVVGRVLNYVSFAASTLFYGLFFCRRADVIYAYHPPLTVGITAALLRLMRRIPVVYDVQDMWPDTLSATGMLNSKRILNVIDATCRWVYRRVDRIVVLSPGFQRLLVQRGVPADKVSVIYNWADVMALSASYAGVPSGFPGPDQFRVVFAGNMGKAQALDTVLDAALLLQSRGSRVSFVMVGAGIEVDRLKQKSDRLALRNVVFLPPVPMKKVGSILTQADALLVHLRRKPLFEITIPSKTQAYMAAGKPLIMAVSGDARDLVVQSGGGVVTEPEDPEALAGVVEALARMPLQDLNDMGVRGRQFYRENLAIEKGVDKFCAVFRGVLRS